MSSQSHILKKVPPQESLPVALFFAPNAERLLKRLPKRSQEMLAARFGLEGHPPQTLEAIGQAHGITRERVRQILKGALGSLSRAMQDVQCSALAERIRSTLAGKSGILETTAFLLELVPSQQREQAALQFCIHSLTFVRKVKASKKHGDVYTLQDFSFERWHKVVETAREALEATGHPLDAHTLFVKCSAKKIANSEKEFFDFLTVSREICQNVFGQWGLSEWSDIRPRGTREKAHLVLKKAGRPLHFRAIAKLIDTYGLQRVAKRASHPQTVHNELIRDKRFVLVGRGVYALAEWGYRQGTVREVIAEIVKRRGAPMTREEVLAAVLRMRQVKKSTVIINLNASFERVGKDKYTLKKEQR